MGYAPVLALANLFEQTGTTPGDIDVIELNEAFASQAVAVIRDAKLNPEKTNPYGGAIALGHPVGATGAILSLRIAKDMVRRDLELGIVTMCHIAVDVTDPDQVQTAVDEAASSARPLRTVVNVRHRPVDAHPRPQGPHDLAFFAKVVQVNLVGTFNVMTLAAEKIAQTEPCSSTAPGEWWSTLLRSRRTRGRLARRRTHRPRAGWWASPCPRRATWHNMAYGCSTIAPGIVETPSALAATVSRVPCRPCVRYPVPATAGTPTRQAPAGAGSRRARLPQR